MKRSKKKAPKASEPKSNPTWECAEGCDLSKKACKHLEWLLPDVNSGALNAVRPDDRIENYGYEDERWVKEEEKYAFFQRLEECKGLNTIHKDVLVAKFVNNLSVRDIGLMYQCSSTWAFKTLKEAVRIIQEQYQ